jgi:hypothetical protein
MAVPYTVSGETFVQGRARAWSAKALDSLFPAMAPDGQHLIAVRSSSGTSDAAGPRHIAVPLDFVDEQRRRVLTK